MNPDKAQHVWGLLTSGIKPPSREKWWKWMEDNIRLDHRSAIEGNYRTTLTPFVRYVYDAMQDPRVKRVTCLISAQSFKSQAFANFFAAMLMNDPGQTMWVMANAEMCEDFIEVRLKSLLENCKATKERMPVTRSENRKDLVQFPGMDLYVRGSNSRAKLESTPIRWLIEDERADWKPGAIDVVRMRLTGFHNAKEIGGGTGGVVDDAFTKDFLDGSQTHCHFRCLACQHSQPYRFGREPTPLFPFARAKGGLKWETSERTRPGGVWNFELMRETVRWECESCGHEHTPADGPAMRATIHAVEHNPTARPEWKSFHSNMFSMPWVSCDWRELAEKWLRALDAKAAGDLGPLRAYITRVLAEPWEERLGQRELDETFDAIRAPYGFNESWPEEVARFMGVDYQAGKAGSGEHFWWVIRSISAGGQRRLVAYGKALSFEELESIRQSYGVPIPFSLIDHGYKGATVARFCAQAGWKPMKSEGDVSFMHEGNVKRYWKEGRCAPGLGTTAHAPRREIKLYHWSLPSFRDLFHNCLTGLTPGFTIPSEPGKEWLKHMSAWIPVEERGPNGIAKRDWKQVHDDDHLRSCEEIILAGMTIAAFHGKCPMPMGTVIKVN